MTDAQRHKIKSMRFQGFGYMQIAKVMGLSRDSIRGFCVRNGLNGFATDLMTEYHKVIEEEFGFELCPHCGMKIEQNKRGRKKKYCSMDCKREWDKTHRKPYALCCDYCGNEFKSLGVKGRKYCSNDCYVKDRFWRKEDAADVAKQILEFKKVSHLPKWLKDLLM